MFMKKHRKILEKVLKRTSFFLLNPVYILKIDNPFLENFQSESESESNITWISDRTLFNKARRQRE